MNLLDWTLPTPEQNLAADEALLDFCEARDAMEVLRFWESPRHFVVVGYAESVATEVNLAACAARGIPVLRRCSGGGTVLQGPGCLNYSVVLRISADGPTRNIAATNQFVMERNRAALEGVLQNPHSEIAVRGHTDLALDGVKFSGNAQRRKRRCLLFHGSILLNLDLALVEALLPMPSRQPDYRQNRPHRDFIRNLPITANAVRSNLRDVWRADSKLNELPTKELDSLMPRRYGRPGWHLHGNACPASFSEM